MNKKKIFSIFKNSIMIVLTAILISFFIMANGDFSISRAGETDNTVTESSELTNEAAAEGAGASQEEIIVSQPDGETGGNAETTETPQGTSTGEGEAASSNTEGTPEGNTEEEPEENSEESSEKTETSEETKTPVEEVFTISHGSDGAVTETYGNFNSAIAGACQIFAEERNPLVIKVKKTSTVSESVYIDNETIDSSALSLTIDFEGNSICFDEGVCFYTRGAAVTFKDSTAQPISFEETYNNIRPGGIRGELGALISSTGSITFESGYYRITNGVIVDGGTNRDGVTEAIATVTVNNGYLLSQQGNITKNAKSLTLNGGFFIYEELVGSSEATTVTFPEGKGMGRHTIIIQDYSVSGYKLIDAKLKVTLHLATDQYYYFAGFSQAVKEAARLSSVNDGAKASIRSIKDDVEIVLSQTVTLSKTAESAAPVVELIDLTIKRGTNDSGAFDKTMFDIKDGTLILNGCTVDGHIEDETNAEISSGSMIIVENGAILYLYGGLEKACSITKNTGLVGATANDPCAGIYMKTGSKLKLKGNVTVNNNIAYTGETQTTEARSDACNIFMAEDSTLSIEGQLAETETYTIGISHQDKPVNIGTIIGSLGSNYYDEVGKLDDHEVDLSAIAMDGATNYELVFNYDNNELYWDANKARLAEAGVFRMEFLILIIGLIGFIVRNLPHIRENEGALRYVTIVSMSCLFLGGFIGFYHIRTEQLLVSRNNEIVEEMFENSIEERPNATSGQTTLYDVRELPEAQTKIQVPADGRNYIGVIEIEALGIRLPVLEKFTDADMKTTPCVYYGCIENNDLVIVGHNYDSQFGSFNGLVEADEIEAVLTLLDGSSYVYRSTGIEYMNPDQVEEMLSGDWDMTLYTCNYAGDKRIAVRFDYK